MKRRLLLGSAVVVLLGGGGLVAAKFGIPPFAPLVQRLRGRATVADRVAEYGEVARARLVPKFAAAGVEYPPSRFILTGLKHERRLDLIAVNASGAMTSIASYPILAASGNLGPKLKEGDGQVPEGFYMIESLNPNSAYHLSLRLDYPNAYDRARAAEEGRTQLGGDIMIHGREVSAGCLAMGDPAIEELFVLAADAGWQDAEVLLCPYDFRSPPDGVSLPAAPAWLTGLYGQLQTTLAKLPGPR